MAIIDSALVEVAYRREATLVAWDKEPKERSSEGIREGEGDLLEVGSSAFKII